jgi:hypothetical protein
MSECSRIALLSMKATTVKLDDAILGELKALKRPNQNLTALVREMLKAQIDLSKIAHAAEEYTSLLRENPAESKELDAWASAPLDREPSSRSRKKGDSGAVSWVDSTDAALPEVGNADPTS